MQIIEDTNNNTFQIRAYQPGEITINNEKYKQSLIIANEHLITDWNLTTIAEITPSHINQILSLKPDIIIIGIGHQAQRPPTLLREFDCMTTDAACRTFIALSSEGRQVAAGLII